MWYTTKGIIGTATILDGEILDNKSRVEWDTKSPALMLPMAVTSPQIGGNMAKVIVKTSTYDTDKGIWLSEDEEWEMPTFEEWLELNKDYMEVKYNDK